MDTDVGLYDSETGDSIKAERVVDLGHDADGGSMSLVYCRAKRGRIVQVRNGGSRVHYFLDEHQLAQDAARVGRMMDMTGENALKISHQNAQA